MAELDVADKKTVGPHPKVAQQETEVVDLRDTFQQGELHSENVYLGLREVLLQWETEAVDL
jgi:hypothetical protein